jgi:hypothetical protein
VARDVDPAALRDRLRRDGAILDLQPAIGSAAS